MINREDLVRSWALEIADVEGFYVTQAIAAAHGWKFPTAPQRNNNPGNLRSWPGTVSLGGFARFKTLADGWNAVATQINLNVFRRQLTFLEFFAGKKIPLYGGYAPSADNNNPTAYALRICRRLEKDFFANLGQADNVKLNVQPYLLVPEYQRSGKVIILPKTQWPPN